MMNELLKCPKCNNMISITDDSFHHEFGIEIIKYYWCEDCDMEIEE